MAKLKYMDIAEFRREGYLQEVNRRFFHPLGLALEVIIEDDGSERLGGVWDCRDDEAGIRFAPTHVDPWKAENIDANQEHRTKQGFGVQSVISPDL